MKQERGRSSSSDAGPLFYNNDDYLQQAIEMPLPLDTIDIGLVPLKTKAETRSQGQTIQAWTVELPMKAANNVLM